MFMFIIKIIYNINYKLKKKTNNINNIIKYHEFSNVPEYSIAILIILYAFWNEV